jgi:hypothetical protein
MDIRKSKSILIIPLALLVIIVIVSLAFQTLKSSDLEGTYWIRVNQGDEVPKSLNTSRFSVRKIESKGFSIVSTLVLVSVKAEESGFKEGDLDFYGSFKKGKIVGMTHYRTKMADCSLDIYSPTKLEVSSDRSEIYGSDRVPQFDPHSCMPWPSSEWTPRNFTLHRIDFEECKINRTC